MVGWREGGEGGLGLGCCRAPGPAARGSGCRRKMEPGPLWLAEGFASLCARDRRAITRSQGPRVAWKRCASVAPLVGTSERHVCAPLPCACTSGHLHYSRRRPRSALHPDHTSTSDHGRRLPTCHRPHIRAPVALRPGFRARVALVLPRLLPRPLLSLLVARVVA